MKRTGHLLRVWSLTLAAAALPGCGGSSSPTPPPPPTPKVVFTPASPAPAPPSITLVEQSRTSSSITLIVRVNGITNLYGVSFDLVWSAATLSYSTSAESAFLRQDGASTSFNAAHPSSGGQQDPGRLTVGITRLGNVVGLSGTGDLMTVTFFAVASGTTGLSFEGSQALDAKGAAIPGVSWAGGAVSVTK